MKGGVIEPPEPGAYALTGSQTLRFNEGGVIEPPEPRPQRPMNCQGLLQ